MAIKRLVIFDFDGTLGDTRRNIVTTMQMTIDELHLPSRTEAECVSTIGLPLAGCFKALYPEIQEEVAQQCATVYRRLFSENLHKIIPLSFPHVKATLAQLQQMGCVLTIASSRSNASLKELTHDMGIDGYFSLFIGADDVTEAKPAPEPVNIILATTHNEASQAIVVGDMAVDILMGVHAGTQTCGVTWGNGSREELERAGADFIINDMKELPIIVCDEDMK